MIGSYDNIAYRIAEAFQIRQCTPFTNGNPAAEDLSSPFDSIISQEWGDAPLTTVSNDRPITLVCWYEHLDGPAPGYIVATPKSGEYPIFSYLGINGPHLANNTPGIGNLDLQHTAFDPDADLHWESYAIRNFPGRDENWVIDCIPLGEKNTLFAAPVSGSTNSKSTASGALPTTRFELYKSIFTIYPGYQWQSHIGPWLALDRVLEDHELFSLIRNPWPYLRKYWSDVMFLVSPVTGEDFGPHQWHFTATYSTPSADAGYNVAAGYVPYIDYSSRSVRGLGHRLYYPVPPPPIIPGEAVPNRLTLLGVGK